LPLLSRAPLEAETQSPVNPHAAPEACALLKYLYSISENYILTSGTIFQTQSLTGPRADLYQIESRNPVPSSADASFTTSQANT